MKIEHAMGIGEKYFRDFGEEFQTGILFDHRLENAVADNILLAVAEIFQMQLQPLTQGLGAVADTKHLIQHMGKFVHRNLLAGNTLPRLLDKFNSIETHRAVTQSVATAILRPNDTISQGFQTVIVTLKDGAVRTGFVTESTSDQIVLRDIAGAVTSVPRADVKEETHVPTSTMPEGLANALSLGDFAALVHFLAAKK